MRKALYLFAASSLVTAAWAAGCGSSEEGTDGGVDAAVDNFMPKMDSGGMDSSKMDSSSMDSSMMMDSSSMDSSMMMDSGIGDAGPSINFMVVRVGDLAADGGDAGALTNASTPAHLEERRSSDGTILRTIDMPIAADGGANPLTLAGTSTSEGALSRSGDGKFVVMGGYAVAPGTASVATSSSNTVKRVAGRVDANGAIDTTTAFDAFSGANIRSVASNDGKQFWAGGSTTGTIYVPLGMSTTTVVQNTVANTRAHAVFGGQLYGSTAANGNNKLFTIGTGLPTMTNQTVTNLNGIANIAANAFALLDLDQNVAGLDTAYIADDNSVQNGGGVKKYKLNNNTWTLAATFSDKLMNQGCFHVVAGKIGNDIHVVCTTAENPSRLIRYIDDGMNLMPTGTPLATAQPGTQFRGVALSPQ